jgi:NADH:ubiquinone oxidoreductase subunit F (NADH-binding)
MSTFTETQILTRAAPPAALPRVLAGMPARGAMGLEEHLAIHGALPHEAHRRRRKQSPLIEQVERAGLLGRGGAAFPTAKKLRAVAGAGRHPIVAINAAEGEPASLKDRTLMQSLPHLVLDGGELAAGALGAEQVIVCVCESSRAAAESAAGAISERRGLDGTSSSMRLQLVPNHYLAGQESALVSHLNGGRALPTFAPPLPFEQGVARRPTLVANAETLAHLALIARHGPDWFRELGMPSQHGSALVTLSGPVARPGVYEIEYGTSMSGLIDAAGGSTGGIRAALVGGYAGSWIDGSLLPTLAMSDEHLAPHGAALGAGVVLLLSEDACPVAETVRVARWLADQSSGQCGPCVHGLEALAATVAEIAQGSARAKAASRIARLASLVERRGACGHPDGAVNFILSAVETFSTEFSDHAHHGSCDACTQPGELPLPGAAREALNNRQGALPLP